MKLIVDDSSCDDNVIEEYNKLVQLYDDKDSTHRVLELILTNYFDDSDFESLNDLIKQDLNFGIYTYEPYYGKFIIRKSNIDTDLPINTFDSELQIINKLIDDGTPRDRILKMA